MTRYEKRLSLLRIGGYYLCEHCVKGVRCGQICSCRRRQKKKPFWYEKELADLKAMREASRYYKPPILTLEEVEVIRRKR